MSKKSPMIQSLRKSNNYSEKTQMLSYLLSELENSPKTFKKNDIEDLKFFLFEETDKLLDNIPVAKSYREKNEMFLFEDKLIGLLLKLFPSSNDVAEDKLVELKKLFSLVDKEMFFEVAIDKKFDSREPNEIDFKELVEIAEKLTDEFHRGRLFAGLVNYKKQLKNISDESKEILAKYTASEFSRYLAKEYEPDYVRDVFENIELAVDVCKYYLNNELAEQMIQILSLNSSEINYYAIDTLLGAGYDVPQCAIEGLARDIVCANLTYNMLDRYDKAHLFPKELTDEVYLAKSDMIQWLKFPTELGKLPDEIEFVGKIESEDGNYFVFRFISDSNTLPDNLKNKWLLGWSCDTGGTFSFFEEYDKYDKGTLEKTLKNIKKKLF